MKMTFVKQILEDEFYTKLYDQVTYALSDSPLDELKEIYRELDEDYRYGKSTPKLTNEVLFWIDCMFEDYFDSFDIFKTDWSEEASNFISKYWLDLIGEIRGMIEDWE